MVQWMLGCFGGDRRKRRPGQSHAGDEFGIECYHVNAQLSDDLHDVGGLRPIKLLRLLRFCAEALFCRFHHQVRILYYIPAPPKISAILRDLLVLLLVRPWFSQVIFHWEAAGLGTFVARLSSGPRRLLSCLYRHDLSIVLFQEAVGEVQLFRPKATAVIPNTIPDPLDTRPIPNREIEPNPTTIHLLFLGHLTAEKGVLDAIHAVVQANRLADQQQRNLRFLLEVGGAFPSLADQTAFQDLVTEVNSSTKPDSPTVRYLGFLNKDEVGLALTRAHLFLFPSRYPGEASPLVVLEALASNLPVVSTRWRGIPDLVGDCGILVEPGHVEALADAILNAASASWGNRPRQRFEEKFHPTVIARALADACLAISGQRPPTQ